MKKLKLVNGLHITSTERKAIKAMIDAGIDEGRAGQKGYVVRCLKNELYVVTIFSIKIDDYKRREVVTDRVVIEYK